MTECGITRMPKLNSRKDKKMTQFKDVYGNTIELAPSSHVEFHGTWLTIKPRKEGEPDSCPCALTSAQIRLFIAALEARLEEIEKD